jgi:hypothetical protein
MTTEKMKNKDDDHSASLLPADPISVVKTETLPSVCIMDYPEGWAFVREKHPDPREHDPRCSWVQASGGILCDCHVLNDEYARRKADIENLMHMLGVSAKHKKGYRNYFVAGPADAPSMERLRAAGFVVKNEGYMGSSCPCYHATLEGAKRIGLTELPR